VTASRQRVAAVGGARLVAAPDPIAAEYLRLGLRLDQHTPGVVDGYYGPADLKAEIDLEQRRAPARLLDDARALAERVGREIDDAGRRAWLGDQLVALQAQAQALAGEPLPYATQVERMMGFAPTIRDDAVFDAAAAVVDEHLPGPGTLEARLEAWDATLEVPVDRLPSVVDWLVDRYRSKAALDFGLPDGEGLRVGLVHDQPWGAYNWYDGGRRSRVDINTDLPVRASSLILLVAHEAYPGHHLEAAWKETDLVDRDGHLEASILLINTPESPISEGLADVGTSFASPLAERADLLVELFERAGMAVAADPVRARDTAERAVELAGAREVLGAVRGNAAMRRHAGGASHEDVLAYLRDVGRFSVEVAAKRLEFIEHPLWRTYAFVYADGAALIERWLEAAPASDRVARFGRLLHEPLTPGRLLAELG
jgi:hypothetical protein